MDYGHQIQEKVNLWKKAKGEMLNGTMTMKDGLEIEYRMQFFVFEEAIKQIEALK